MQRRCFRGNNGASLAIDAVWKFLCVIQEGAHANRQTGHNRHKRCAFKLEFLGAARLLLGHSSRACTPFLACYLCAITALALPSLLICLAYLCRAFRQLDARQSAFCMANVISYGRVLIFYRCNSPFGRPQSISRVVGRAALLVHFRLIHKYSSLGW